MRSKLILAAATLGLASPAFAAPPPWAPANGWRQQSSYDDGRYDRDYRQQSAQYRYADDGSPYWRGDDGRYYCRRSNGTTGLLIGGVAGALLGRTVDRKGDRLVGTLIGAAAGAFLGREIDRSSSRCK